MAQPVRLGYRIRMGDTGDTIGAHAGGGGLDAAAMDVLSYVADATPPPGFVQFWSSWRDRLMATSPALREETPDPASCGAGGVTHVVESIGGVRLGCRLIARDEFADKPRGVVLQVHGYAVAPGTPISDDLPVSDDILDAGWAVLKVRVRGYPGSQGETGDLTQPTDGVGFAGRDLGDPERWPVGLAIADVVQAARAVRSRFGLMTPVVFGAESFGAGLGVVAAAVGRGDGFIDRLVIGLPTLGAWGYRLGSDEPAPEGSMTAHVLAGIEASGDAEAARRTLALHDAVVHAARIVVPVLCKLAIEDPVVPARTQAAIYNALGTSPGMKWRFAAPVGHVADAGIANARRHAAFSRLAAQFIAAGPDYGPVMRRWEPDLLAMGQPGEGGAQDEAAA
jgi:cephalosporin-C deacetylase-like acetyl esterase